VQNDQRDEAHLLRGVLTTRKIIKNQNIFKNQTNQNEGQRPGQKVGEMGNGEGTHKKRRGNGARERIASAPAAGSAPRWCGII